jgi:hypothetical protein
MKKYLSYLLVFSLFFFSFFSTGCGRSGGGFKFLGALVAGSIIAATAGSGAAVFAANTRGAAAEVKITDANAKLYVYELNKSATNLQGAIKINGKSVKLENGELTFKLTAEEERLDIGEYLFVVKHTGADKPFLRAILSVLGNTNDISDMKISPTTEVTTQVYKAWVDKAPTNDSFVNFEANAKTDKTFDTKIEAKAKEYSDDLIEWSTKADTDKQNDAISDVTVTEIDVPAKDLAKLPEQPADTEFAKKVPVALQSYTWKDVTIADISDSVFYQVYQKRNSTWYEFKEEEKTNYISISMPSISFMNHDSNEDSDEGPRLDMHNNYTSDFMKWLLEQANNSNVITIPRYTSNDYSNATYEDPLATYLNEKEITYLMELESSTFVDDFILTNSILKLFVRFNAWEENETEGSIEYEAKIGTNGSSKYLYLKNKDENELAEKIYKYRERSSESRRQ